MPHYARAIQPFVDTELRAARAAEAAGDVQQAFAHLERAHVLGQSSTWLHVRVHGLMLFWGLRQHRPREVVGQVLRMLGAASKTALGWVPAGNTGGANVSPFKPMPICDELAQIMDRARR